MPLDDTDRRAIEALADILNAKGLSEIEYEHLGLRIRVASAGPRAAPAPAGTVAVQPRSAQEPEGAGGAVPDSGLRIESPMVGTFYAAASPDASPFVAVGDRVRKGQVVCIIEAMKLMNEIECEHEGVVAERLVENGQAVEFGQPLFRIDVG